MINSLKISAIAALAAASLMSTPASALSLNLGGSGPLLSLGGNTTTEARGGLTLGNLLGGTEGSTPIAPSGNSRPLVNLGEGNRGVVNLDLGGNSRPITASVNLGGGSTSDASVLANLFGPPEQGPTARLDLNTGGGDGLLAALPITNGGPGDTSVILDLFGNGGGGVSSGNGGASPQGHDGPNGHQPGDDSGVLIANVSGDLGVGAGVGGSCFTPNGQQVATLASRHSYGENTFASWAGANSVKVVDLNICGAGAAQLRAQDNIAELQAFVSANVGLRTQLAQQGHKPGDVIAVDRSKRTLIVYTL